MDTTDDDSILGGLLNIDFSDSDFEPTKAQRTTQTEACFQAVRKNYQPRVENGDVRSPTAFFPHRLATLAL